MFLDSFDMTVFFNLVNTLFVSCICALPMASPRYFTLWIFFSNILLNTGRESCSQKAKSRQQVKYVQKKIAKSNV